MPRAPKVCGTPNCPHTQPCSDHPKIPWQGSTRRTELPPDWNRRRAKVLKRDPVCTLGITCAGPDGVPLALSVDCHHTGRKDDHRLESLAGVCRACHKAATAAQATEARRARA